MPLSEGQTKKNLEIFYWKGTELWKIFCEKHKQLLEKTSEEYTHLLAGDVEQLENCLKEKKGILKKIGYLEKTRQIFIQELDSILEEKKAKKIADLLKIMSEFETEKKQRYFFQFNSLLKDLIEKIQFQNKKNQLFINKTLHSLQSFRERALGEKHYSSYNEKGMTLKAGA